MPAQKQMPPAACRICALIEEGKLSGYWKEIQEVAQLIDIPRGTLSSHAHGDVKDEEVLATTERKIQEKMAALSEGKPQPEPHALLVKVRTTFLEGVRQNQWSHIYGCAETLKIDTGSFARYIKGTVPIDSERKETYLKGVLKRMRRKLRLQEEQTDEVPAPSADNRPRENSDALPQGTALEPLMETVIRKTVGEVLASLPVTDVLPLILTACNIRRLTGTVNDDQIAKIVGALQSLTRAINHITQIDSVDERARVWRQLRPHVEEFYLALELGKEANPSSAADRIANLRQKFQDLR